MLALCKSNRAGRWCANAEEWRLDRDNYIAVSTIGKFATRLPIPAVELMLSRIRTQRPRFDWVEIDMLTALTRLLAHMAEGLVDLKLKATAK